MKSRFTVVAALIVAAIARAYGQDAPVPKSSVRLEVDNDLIALRGGGAPPDYDYTGGIRLSKDWRRSPRLFAGVALGQEVYTPRHNLPEPVPGDRPHAAWLYIEGRAQRLGAVTLQTIAVRTGVIGPPALGEVVQNGVHRLLHNHSEVGWANQLPTRFGVTAQYDAARVFWRGASTASPSRFVEANAGGELGTLRRAVHAGVSGYYGFGTTRTPTADAPLVTRAGRFYLTAGYRQSFVLHDAFVEGIGSTRGAVRIPWVGEAHAAAGWRFTRFALEYRYVSRGREYDAQPGRHAYGAITLSLVGR